MSDERASRPVVVIGAGQAGLAAAAMLRARRVPAVVSERAEQVGASWRGHYDRLRLHTARWLSHLPGCPIPRAEGRWVTRDGVIRYLESYVAHHNLEVRTGIGIARIDRWRDGWILRSPQGDLHAHAVVATGCNHTPLVPEWPGRDDFRGELLHASEYANGSAYRGRDVLVVGTGNTGAEIAVDLTSTVHRGCGWQCELRRTSCTARNSLFPHRSGAFCCGARRRVSPMHLSREPAGCPCRACGTRASPIQDVGLVEAILADRAEPVAAVAALNDNKVVLADGAAL